LSATFFGHPRGLATLLLKEKIAAREKEEAEQAEREAGA